MQGEYPCEAWLIKMALKSSTHEKCSCFSPDDFGDLSSKQREGTVRISLVRTQNVLSVFVFA